MHLIPLGEKANSNPLKHKSKKNKKEQIRRNSDTPSMASSLNEYKECSSFSEIMDMEFACQLHREEKVSLLFLFFYLIVL